jgi:hypothetical protein
MHSATAFYNAPTARSSVLWLQCAWPLTRPHARADKLGARVVNVACCLFCLSGQFCVASGAYIESFNLMLAGRVLFGESRELLRSKRRVTAAELWYRMLAAVCPRSTVHCRPPAGRACCILFVNGISDSDRDLLVNLSPVQALEGSQSA